MTVTLRKTTPIIAETPADFIAPEEKSLVAEFLKNGIVTIDVEHPENLNRIQKLLADAAAAQLGKPAPTDAESFLNTIHTQVSPDALNAFRVHLIALMQSTPWLREAYYSLGRRAIDVLVGNELVMQRSINLSIQLPQDESSLLALHSDVWSGDSPYEVVLWVPYVSCFGTKSMYFCAADVDARVQPNLSAYKNQTSEDLYTSIANDAPFCDVPYGKALIFTQNIMHGNRVNETNETRWSSNCRFKSALSPYADKKLGEFFEPITLRPTTRLGLRYALPEGF